MDEPTNPQRDTRTYNRRKACGDCPLVGNYCESHHRITEKNAILFERLRVKGNLQIAVVSVATVVLGFLLYRVSDLGDDVATAIADDKSQAKIFAKIDASVEEIRRQQTLHRDQHVTGNFQPSKGAQPRSPP